MKQDENKVILKWRRNSAGCQILNKLWKQGGLAAFELKKQLVKQGRQMRRNTYEVALGRCLHKGWVVEAEKAGQQFLKLTKEGELQALLACLCQGRTGACTRNQPRSARLWLAVFDIPEVARKIRDFLRWFLRMIGFKQLQKSVYISTQPISKTALRYLENSGLRKYIRLMQVKEADNLDELLKLGSE